MSSPNYVSMEEIPLEQERDSIEYKILMAYAQRRLSVSKYERLLKNEANVQKTSSLTRRKVEVDHQWDQDGPSGIAVFQAPMVKRQGLNQSKMKYLPGHLPFLHSREKQEKAPTPSLLDSQHQTSETADVNYIADKLAKLVTSRSQKSPSDVPLKIVFQGPCLQQDDSEPTDGSEGETADVNYIADKLAKLVTSRSQKSPSDVPLKIVFQGPCLQQDDSEPTDGSEDKEKTIQTIVSLLKQSGDKLEEKMKKDRAFYQRFTNMLSYTFFERIADLFLEGVSAGSTSEPGSQVQCTKVAFTMEVATRLTAVDNHPMNLVLGFGLKYLREHFKPWIQEQGGWEKALSSLAEEEVE